MDRAEDMLANAKHLTCLLCQMTRTPRVLVVDDTRDDLEHMLKMLKRFECEAVGCRTGEEAEALLSSDKFDVVFLDVRLPKLSGHDILERVAGNYTDTNFVVVTGFPDAPVTSRALRSGAKLVFEKPLRADILALFFKPHHERT